MTEEMAIIYSMNWICLDRRNEKSSRCDNSGKPPLTHTHFLMLENFWLKSGTNGGGKRRRVEKQQEHAQFTLFTIYHNVYCTFVFIFIFCQPYEKNRSPRWSEELSDVGQNGVRINPKRGMNPCLGLPFTTVTESSTMGPSNSHKVNSISIYDQLCETFKGVFQGKKKINIFFSKAFLWAFRNTSELPELPII